MATQLSASPPKACFRAVSRHVINRERGCLLLHVDTLWQVAERRAGHAEALDVAVGEAEFLPGNPVVTASAILTPALGEAAAEPGTDWLVVERGTAGPRVEVWEVVPEVIARGVWDGWISEPGWYWQPELSN